MFKEVNHLCCGNGNVTRRVKEVKLGSKNPISSVSQERVYTRGNSETSPPQAPFYPLILSIFRAK